MFQRPQSRIPGSFLYPINTLEERAPKYDKMLYFQFGANKGKRRSTVIVVVIIIIIPQYYNDTTVILRKVLDGVKK